MNADPKFDAFLGGYVGILPRHRDLDFARPPQGIDDTSELGQQTVSGSFDDAPSMRCTEYAIRGVRGSNRADGPAIDARGSTPSKEAAVIGRVAGHSRPFAFCIVKHANLRCMLHAS